MGENWHTKTSGNFKCRARLRSIQQQIALCALDQKADQSEFSNGTFNFTRRPFTAIGINGRKAVNTAGVSGDQPSEVIVHRHDRFVRYATFRIGNQLDQNTDNTSVQMAVAEVL